MTLTSSLFICAVQRFVWVKELRRCLKRKSAPHVRQNTLQCRQTNGNVCSALYFVLGTRTLLLKILVLLFSFLICHTTKATVCSFGRRSGELHCHLTKKILLHSVIYCKAFRVIYPGNKRFNFLPLLLAMTCPTCGLSKTNWQRFKCAVSFKEPFHVQNKLKQKTIKPKNTGNFQNNVLFLVLLVTCVQS